MFDRKKDFIDLIQHEYIKPEKTVVIIQSIQTSFLNKRYLCFYLCDWMKCSTKKADSIQNKEGEQKERRHR